MTASSETAREPDFIDIEKAIEQKSVRLRKAMPGFIIRYLKRITHQDDMNAIIRDNAHLRGVPFVDGSLRDNGIKWTAYGKENVPREGRFIFVSNHPLGGLDGMIFIREVATIFPDVRFPVNDLLLNVKNFGDIFLPINKHGGQSRDAARAIEEAYASDHQILYFPAGLCSRKKKGKICDLQWKKHFVHKAVQHQRDVIPVYFSGRNSNWFYNLSNFRNALGIKANLEMLYLVDEMFKQRYKPIDMIFGKPIPYSTFDRSKTHQEWADYLKAEVYSLADKLEELKK